MEVTARLRHLQGSPQKMRLVADLIRGADVELAATVLKHTHKRAARPLEKLLKSAVANAENLHEDVDIDRLYVKEIFVDGGPVLKRVWFTTMGRAYRKVKRQSHVTIKLGTRAADDENRRRSSGIGTEDASLRLSLVLQQDVTLSVVRRQ